MQLQGHFVAGLYSFSEFRTNAPNDIFCKTYKIQHKLYLYQIQTSRQLENKLNFNHNCCSRLYSSCACFQSFSEMGSTSFESYTINWMAYRLNRLYLCSKHCSSVNFVSFHKEFVRLELLTQNVVLFRDTEARFVGEYRKGDRSDARIISRPSRPRQQSVVHA